MKVCEISIQSSGKFVCSLYDVDGRTWITEVVKSIWLYFAGDHYVIQLFRYNRTVMEWHVNKVVFLETSHATQH